MALELNISKCRSMRVYRQNNACTPYYINHSTLSWIAHDEYVTNNANRLLGHLKRKFSLTPISFKLLYKTLIRTKLEYTHSIWDQGITFASAIGSIRNRYARSILSNYHRTASVSSMKASLSLPSLSSCRKLYRLCLFHKIFHYNPVLRRRSFLKPSYISSRIDEEPKVGVPHCTTSFFERYFSFPDID